MGDVSVIARRLSDGHVQHGWSGNGGYFRMVGARLLQWYTEPQDVEYLFSLGQLRMLGAPNSEHGGFGFMNTHSLTGTPHYLGTEEDDMFSKIAFVDYGYFYDIDNKWYYISPGVFHIKMPLELVANNLDDRGFEFEFKREIQIAVLQYILEEYIKVDKDFQNWMADKGYDGESIFKEYKEREYMLYDFAKNYSSIVDYFDQWIVVIPSDDYKDIAGFKLKKRTEKHIETCEW